MLSNGRVLESVRSKSDEKIGDEVKFESPENIHFVGVVRSRSITGSIDCKVYEEDVVRRESKLTDKMREYQLDKQDDKHFSLHKNMIRKTNTVEDMLYSYRGC